MKKTVLILGANGRFGRHSAEAFWNAGWTVRFFDRRTDNLTKAAAGADVIVAAWNPPYTQWASQVSDLHKQIQRAAREAGACVLLPGNVYVYSKDAPSPWSESSPHNARNPLGRIRIDLERSYRESGVQTIVLRAGDFIDTRTSGSWLDKIILASLKRGYITYPGAPDIAHAWAYLPDLARAAEEVAAQKETLSQYEDVTFPGYTLSANQIAKTLSTVSGFEIGVSRMSWKSVQMLRPFWPLAKHLLEMRYLWDTPHSLHSARFHDLCPYFHETPVETALTRAASAWLAPQSKTIGWFQFNCKSTHTNL